MENLKVKLVAPEEAKARDVVQEYVFDRVDDTTEVEGGEFGGFAYDTEEGSRERNAIALSFNGDSDAILESEKSKWNALVEDGLLKDWEEVHRMEFSKLEAMMGERRAEVTMKSGLATTKMAKVMYDEFDEFPDPVNTFPEEFEEHDVGGPYGLWSIFHMLAHQMQYNVREEMEAYRQGVRYCLRNIAEHEGEAVADEELDAFLDTMEGMREVVKEGRPDP